MMNTRIITTEQELIAVKDDWDNLVRSNPETDMPFYSWDWFYRSYLHFGKPEGKELFVVATEDSGRLCGLLPLVRGTKKTSKITYKVLEFCNTGITPRNNVFYCPQYDSDTVFNAIKNALFEKSKQWDMLCLANVPETAAFHTFLLSKHNSSCAMMQTKGLNSPYIELSGTIDDYLAMLHKKVRYNINRYVKLFETNTNKPAVRFFQKPEEQAEALSAGSAVRQNSWKGSSDTSRFFAFWNDVLPELYERNEAVFLTVLLDDVPIGACYRLCRNGIYYGFGTDYHQDYKKDSPGILMFYYLLRHITENDGKVFDFCGSDYDYKSQYTSLFHAHSTFQIFHSGLKSRFIYWAKTVLLPLYRKMFRKPPPGDFIMCRKYVK
ncbi:MAG: GNAT family N-acetyltransferase [Planctomycetaceae bacterium]|nr:GNAT family N-acetyltransferase [Planctomycetaceae bacterium]